MNKLSCSEKVKKLFEYAEYDGKGGKSKIVFFKDFYEWCKIPTTHNGGDWYRKDNSELSKFFDTIVFKKTSKKLEIKEKYNSRQLTDFEKTQYHILFRNVKPSRSNIAIQIIGKRKYPKNSKKPYQKFKSLLEQRFGNICVHCGASKTEIDHKDDSIHSNDFDISVDDLQLLCKHCNDIKRSRNVWEHKNKKIYSGSKIPIIQSLCRSFPWEKYDYDTYIECGKKCSYWYDPIVFIQKCRWFAKYDSVMKELK